MKAIIQDRYGSPDVLELREIAEPVAKDDEVLVRVHAASVHPDVWHVVRGVPYVLRIMGAGVRKPRNPVPGIDLAGRVEAVGAKVTRFRPGEEVFGEIVRGIQWHNGGAFAEYATAPEAKLAPKPANLTFEQAAAVPTSALIALQAVRHQGHVQAGQEVLVNGAGGGVGTFAVQLAKADGAHVTGVDSTSKLDLIRSMGADRVIDYTQEDFTRSGERYDVIVDIPGTHAFSDLRRALKRTGTYVYIGHDRFGRSGARWFGGIGRFLRLAMLNPFVPQQMNPRIAKGTEEPLVVLKELVEAGKLTPAIDKTFPLSEVPEAIRYLETGQALGKLVITVLASA
jgi:NADPH:quinone reductase-like Zn-dependent oxidoreductase